MKHQNIDGYVEKHHIIPKSLGGSNKKDNIILLTARQHYVAHWLLWKAYKGSMTTAFNYMSGISRYGKRLNSRTAEKLKLEEIHKQKQRVFTAEHREKLRQAKLGKKLTEEHKANVGRAQLGRKLSEETKRKISKTKKAKNASI